LSSVDHFVILGGGVSKLGTNNSWGYLTQPAPLGLACYVSLAVLTWTIALVWWHSASFKHSGEACMLKKPSSLTKSIQFAILLM
jgi:hypothetical protein